ncbi:MAG: PAS domain S-box protein, partial [Chloroflexi bacterium]|nr:PAS domain S-box protein [Chloroflexota bacterium]
MDGATGTQLQKMGLPAGMAPELWNLQNPKAVKQHYRAYIEAGSDAILTNTFGGTRPRLDMEGSGHLTHEINRAAAALAREAAGDEVLVLGSMGPTGLLMEPMGELTYEKAVEYFAEQAAALAEGLRSAISRRQSVRVELIASEAGGASLDAEGSLSPIENRSGTVTAIVCSIHDISAHKRLEEQLRQTLDQQVELNELKSRFVAMAAHDLRNPLSVIQTAIELLRRYNERMTDAQRQERYERIQASIEFMIALLDDILLIGRAESHTLTPNLQRVDLPGLCREIVTEIEQTSAAKHRVVFDFEAQSQDAVTDPKLLRHILSNLLDNAAKYSPAGSTITFGA